MNYLRTDNLVELKEQEDEQGNTFFNIGTVNEGRWLCLYLDDVIKLLNKMGYEVYENSANSQNVNKQEAENGL